MKAMPVPAASPLLLQPATNDPSPSSSAAAQEHLSMIPLLAGQLVGLPVAHVEPSSQKKLLGEELGLAEGVPVEAAS